MVHYTLVCLAIILFGALGYVFASEIAREWSRVKRRRLLHKTQASYLSRNADSQRRNPQIMLDESSVASAGAVLRSSR
jgi:hypothetical protein